MYVGSSMRRRGLAAAIPCLSGTGPLQEGQSFCEGNDTVLATLKDYWSEVAPPPPPAATFNYEKYVLPVGAAVFALLLLSAVGGRR